MSKKAGLILIAFICVSVNVFRYVDSVITNFDTKTSCQRSLDHAEINLEKALLYERFDNALKLTCHSVKLNLSVTVYDSSDNIFTGYPFELTLTSADEDKNGIIHFTELMEVEITTATEHKKADVSEYVYLAIKRTIFRLSDIH